MLHLLYFTTKNYPHYVKFECPLGLSDNCYSPLNGLDHYSCPYFCGYDTSFNNDIMNCYILCKKDSQLSLFDYKPAK